MRILTWNMARGPRRKELDGDPWAVLAALEPDIALLQECRPPPGRPPPGHLHFVPSAQGWGTAIWSRFPLATTGDLPDGAEAERALARGALEGYVASAEVQVQAEAPILCVCVHAYPAAVKKQFLAGIDSATVKPPLQSKVWPGDLAWWTTSHLPSRGCPAVLGGDWNTARLFDRVYRPRGNQQFFDRMQASGWHEAMRKFNPDEVRTYFCKGRGPYQLDHVFLTSDLFARLTGASVAATEDVLRASDHAPVVLELDMGT